jgi:hypothetical protein
MLGGETWPGPPGPYFSETEGTPADNGESESGPENLPAALSATPVNLNQLGHFPLFDGPFEA